MWRLKNSQRPVPLSVNLSDGEAAAEIDRRVIAIAGRDLALSACRRSRAAVSVSSAVPKRWLKARRSSSRAAWNAAPRRVRARAASR